MKKFAIADWVFDEKTNRTGFVKNLVEGERSVKVRWIGELRADKDKYSAARLIHRRPIPFILEGHLEDNIYEKSRSEQPLLHRWLEAIGFEFSVKSVCQLSDIELFAKEILAPQHPPFIHISCHGDVNDDCRPYITLFKDNIFLDDPETIRIFKLFKGIPIFFSACNLGKYEKPIRNLMQAAELGSIAASTREILDSEAMMFGLMLYQCMLIGGMTFEKATNSSLAAFKNLGIKGLQGHKQTCVRLFS